MKFFTALLLAMITLSSASAQSLDFDALLGRSSTAPREIRNFRQLGVSVTRGNDSGWTAPSFGYTFRNLTFFDSSTSQGGWYWGLGLAVAHLGGGGVTIGDQQLITLGWMGNPLAWSGEKPILPFDVALGTGPTLGTRVQGNTILGSLYTGIGFTVGLHWSVFDDQDVGISWEPVIPLTSWGGPPAPDSGYMDFVVAWTTKLRTRTSIQTLPWTAAPHETR